jgi:hypothetical protein
MGRLAASLGFLSDTIFTFCLSPCRQTYPPGQNLSTILHIHKRCYDCRHGFAVRSGGSGNLTKASLLAQRGYGGAQRHGLMRGANPTEAFQEVWRCGQRKLAK